MEIIIQKADGLDQYLLECFKKDFTEGVRDFFLPAGGTPENFYKLLLESYSELQERGFGEAHFWQIDEILNGQKSGLFRKFFKEHLGPWNNQLIGINESYLLKDKIQQSPAVAFLGLGVNGHVAFHEPHIPSQFSLGCVELGMETLGYLKLEQGTWGVTYGVETFINCKKIYLMVKGPHKAEILERFMSDDESVPAVRLKKHPQLVLLADDLAFKQVA